MISFPDELPMTRWTQKIRSRYSETDKMGYVYYGRYLEYFEEARTEMVRQLGFPYSEMEQRGVMLPVVEASLSYRSPIFYDEVMNVEVAVFEPPMVRLVTWYRVTTSRHEVSHVEGRVTLAFTDMGSRRPCRAPVDFVERLQAGLL